jgi:hypothetical protein
MRIQLSPPRARMAALLLCLAWLMTAVGASAQPMLPTVLAASDGLQVAVTPAVVPANGSFTLSVRNADGSAYSGLLDYDALICPTNSITSADCRVSHADDPWANAEVVSGTVTISIDNADGNGTTLADSMYIVRYRPHNSSGQYSNQIAFVVDRAARPVSEATMNNDGRYPVPQPVAGAYVVYRDVAADGSLNGYTKVEIEQSACGGNGLMQRFTKTAAGAYWSPGDPQSTTIATLRWCIGPSATSPTNFRATDILGYSFDKSSTSATSLRNTRYDDAAFGNLARLGTLPSTQAEADRLLLNGAGPQNRLRLQQKPAQNNGLRTDASTDPASLFYTLVPSNLFPPLLTNEWTPIVDRIISYDATNKVFDTWHVEVRASQLGGLYEIRYVEWGLYIENLSAQSSRASTPSQSVSDWNLFYRWNVLEDWDWNADGTQNRITQQGTNRAVRSDLGEPPGDLPIDCWRTRNGCTTPVKHRLDKVLRYQPDTRPLVVSFVDNFGSDVPVLNGRANQPLRLHVRTADGQPYDGFLQLATGAGGRTVWTDAGRYPIYVHNGLVEVLPSAFGSAASTVLSFKVRQQTLNDSIAADKILTNVSQPTNEAQSFSNEVYFVQTFS